MSGTLDNLSALYLQDPALASALRNRMYAEKLRAAGSDTSPIQSPWQGVNRLAQGLLGGFEESQSDQALKDLSDKQAAALDSSRSSYNLPDALRGTPMPPMPPMAQAVAGQPAQGGASPIHMAESGGSMQPGIYGDGGAAAGPMQVHQAALADVNQRLGTNYTHPQLAADPAVGKQVGDEYHKMLLEQFGGDEAKAAAAYNAGPGRVTAAVQAYGPDWMKGIPQSAQAYVAKVTGGQGAASTPAVNADAQRFDLMRQQGEFIQQQAMQNARNPNRQIAGEAQMQFERGKQMIAQAEAGMARVDARGIAAQNRADARQQHDQTRQDARDNRLAGTPPAGFRPKADGSGVEPIPGAPPGKQDTLAVIGALGPKIAAGTATPEEITTYNTHASDYVQPRVVTTERGTFTITPQLPPGMPAPKAASTEQPAPGTQPPGVTEYKATDRDQPTQIASGIMTNAAQLKKIDAAIEALDAHKTAVGRGNTMLPGMLKDIVDSGGVDARAKLADLSSMILHDRAGSAMTPQELQRVKPFIPEATDTYEIAQTKLKKLRAEVEGLVRDQYNVFGPSSGYRSLAPVEDALKPRGNATPSAVPEPPSGFRVVQ